jgi:hypothetical protein
LVTFDENDAAKRGVLTEYSIHWHKG